MNPNLEGIIGFIPIKDIKRILTSYNVVFYDDDLNWQLRALLLEKIKDGTIPDSAIHNFL